MFRIPYLKALGWGEVLQPHLRVAQGTIVVPDQSRKRSECILELNFSCHSSGPRPASEICWRLLCHFNSRLFFSPLCSSSHISFNLAHHHLLIISPLCLPILSALFGCHFPCNVSRQQLNNHKLLLLAPIIPRYRTWGGCYTYPGTPCKVFGLDNMEFRQVGSK